MEPARSFQGAAAKINWSNELIDQLKIQVAEFVKLEPYEAVVKANPGMPGQALHASQRGEIPVIINMLIGDIVGNLRASLDYAWMGLVRSAEGTDADKKTLPIGSNEKSLITTIEKAPIGGAVSSAKTVLVDSIKAHRDFASGGNKSLAILNDLSNWNKHNLILTTVGAVSVPAMTDAQGNRFGRMRTIGKHHGPIISFPNAGAGDVTQQGEATFEILFGKHPLVEHEPVIPTLIQLAQATFHMLKAFVEAFPHERNPKFVG